MIRPSRFLSFLVCSFFILGAWSQSPSSGDWVGSLIYDKIEIPIAFSIAYPSKGEEFTFTIINGDERIILTKMERIGDSIKIPIRPFDAFLKLKISPNLIAGTWEKPYRDLKVSLKATPGNTRIIRRTKTVEEVANRWAVTFKPGTKDAYSGIALLKQEGDRITGTVMAEVGDFRYFEGIVDGDSIKLSSFDGAHGFYILGTRTQNGWSGVFHFDPSYLENWTAVEDTEMELRDPFDFVQISGEKRVPYYDILAAGSGKNAIDPNQYKGQVLVIQLFGTWCPNSLDETNFLLFWYQNKPNGVDVLAVTFEPNYSKEYGESRIAEYKDYLAIPYDVFLGGRMSKSQAAIAFPFMDKIEAFPTLIIVDKQGNARYIHSYFNGPATGSYFETFKKQFQEKIDALLSE